MKQGTTNNRGDRYDSTSNGIIWLPWLRDSATLHVPSCCQGVIVVNNSCSDGFGRSIAGNNRLKGGSIFHIGSTNGTCYIRGTFNWFKTSESSEGLKNLNHPSTGSTDSSTQFSNVFRPNWRAHRHSPRKLAVFHLELSPPKKSQRSPWCLTATLSGMMVSQW